MKCFDQSTAREYLRGLLPPEARQAMSEHALTCADCQGRIERAELEEITSHLSAEDTPDLESNTGKSTTPDWPPGTQIGRYLLLQKLGAGGMGVIYAAYDPQLDRKVAIKLLKTSRNSSSESHQRLLREAQAMARVSHRNVAAVFDAGSFEDRVFIAMELIDGSNLREWLRREPRRWQDVLRVLREAGRGLAAAHEAGLVHRDFKPDNVLVGKDQRVVVTDFGLARLAMLDTPAPAAPTPLAALQRPAPELSHIVTQMGTVIGTPSYMAPEQHRGHVPDARSDQFSFCVSLYEGLYGQRPFDADEVRLLVEKVSPETREARPKSLERRTRAITRADADRMMVREPPKGSKIPAWLRRVILRGLSFEPDARYPTMDALLAELARDPRRKWRRRLMAVGAGAVVALAVAGVVQVRAEQGMRCRGAGARLSGVWDEPRRKAIRAAFQQAAPTYAPATLARVESILDRRTRDWQAMHIEACEATAVRGEQSPAMLDLRMGCLNRRLSELQTLTDLFARADGQVVEKAVTALENLTPLQGCADLTALASAIKPPQSPELAGKVEQLRRRLDQAKAFEDAGKYAEGLPIAEAAVAEAKTIPYRPLQAEALYRLGVLQHVTGDPRRAEATLDEAVWAAEASRYDEIAIRAMNRLTFLVGYQEGKVDEGHRWARRATSVIERTGETGIVLAHHYNDLATVLFTEGKYEEGIDLLRRSEEIKERILGADSHDLAIALGNLGKAHSLMGRYSTALKYIQRALAIDERVLGREHPAVAHDLNLMIPLYFKLGRLAEAAEYAQRSLDITRELNAQEGSELAEVLGLLGEARRKQGKLAEAVELNERALALYNKAVGQDSPLYIESLVRLGRTRTDQGDFTKATAELKEALHLVEKTLGPKHLDAVGPLIELGRLHLERHNPTQAVAFMERALALRESSIGEPATLAEVRFVLARSLWDAGADRRRAVHLAELARGQYSLIGTPDEISEVQRWLEQHHL